MSMQQLITGNCLDQLKGFADNSIDSIVTDPPYGLSFMGKKWDYDVPSVEIWAECLRVLKPGGHLLAFAGTRTQHRMAVRIEDAGFEIRDMIAWIYGSGFPKSHNIGKAVDKLQGNERDFVQQVKRTGKATGTLGAFAGNNIETKGTSPHEGWGTALKPALEPITVARKPLTGTVAANVLEWGTGGINVDGCRVGTDSTIRKNHTAGVWSIQAQENIHGSESGRFPANLIHDGSEEVVSLFPVTNASCASKRGADRNGSVYGTFGLQDTERGHNDNGGSAARFFYCPKASKRDRNDGCDDLALRPGGSNAKGYTDDVAKGVDRNRPVANFHPTVKPTELMRYLCRLVTPPGGTVLDPFMGSGSTGKAAKLEGFNFIGIEMDEAYVDIASARIEAV